MERSKRVGAGAKTDKFAALKAARQGQTRASQWKVYYLSSLSTSILLRRGF